MRWLAAMICPRKCPNAMPNREKLKTGLRKSMPPRKWSAVYISAKLSERRNIERYVKKRAVTKKSGRMRPKAANTAGKLVLRKKMTTANVIDIIRSDVVANIDKVRPLTLNRNITMKITG